MAKPSKVSIPLVFGRRDTIDPKHAPFGVLQEGQNIRVREDGRLGSRHGYTALGMVTQNGTLVAYDLFRFQSRLCALGSDDGDGYPTDVFEFTGKGPFRDWRGTDTGDQRVTINPFTAMRTVAGVPAVDSGITELDSACGGGFVFISYKAGGQFYELCVDSTTDQVIYFGGTGTTGEGNKVVWVSDRFIIASSLTNNSLIVRRFIPESQFSPSSIATVVGSSANAITAFDLAVVTNPTNSNWVISWDIGTAGDLQIELYNTAGSQQGSAILVAGTNTIHLSIEADEADDSVSLYTVETATTAVLRSFQFDGTGIAGPTTLTSSDNGNIVRLPTQGTVVVESIALVNNQSSDGIIRGEVFRIDTHASLFSQTYGEGRVQTRVVSGQTPNQDIAMVVGGYVEPLNTSSNRFTNTLFFLTQDNVHTCFRDYTKGATAPVEGGNLSLDTTTGKLCWGAVRLDPNIVSLPSVVTVGFQSTERRQNAELGELVYFTGAAPWVYDGRIASEQGFGELPGIESVTASNGAGALANNATYDYVVVWEYTLSDGSFIQGPPSEIVQMTTGASDDTGTIVVTTPHSVKTSDGLSLYGATVTLVLFRTGFNAATSSQRSEFKRTASIAAGTGIANYGDVKSITDLTSDSDLADNETLYTQAGRGAFSGLLEHNAPRSCEFVAATESRLLHGGLLNASNLQHSKEAFLGEPISWSEFSAFFNLLPGRIKGVQSLDGVKLVFTTDEIFSLGGEGADDQGGGGLTAPSEIPTPSGLKKWQSFLKDPGGLWFQLDDDKLFRMPRGSGAPQWTGSEIKRLLSDFPDIIATATTRRDNAAVFACQNAGKTDARLAIYDYRTGLWFTDAPPLESSKGIESMVRDGDTLSYISGGVVYRQSGTTFTDGGTVITTLVRTQPLYPFGLGGYGLIHAVVLTAEYRSAGTITLKVSYDDGLNFTTQQTFALTALTVGQTIKRKWTLAEIQSQSLVLEFSFVPDAVSEGLVYNEIDIYAENEGGIPEFDPAEMA